MMKKTFSAWRRLAVISAIIILPFASASADDTEDFFANLETDKGAIVNFTVPMEVNGVKTQELRGARAVKKSDDRLSVQQLQVQTYGQNPMTLTMPLADFFLRDKTLTTSRGVHILYPTREVTADKMTWNLNQKQGKLSGNVRVVMKGFDLQTGADPERARPAAN
ncbi:MAG: LPS export ABC transporter periplasmic protein LptC [Candidatus Methylacidiphilales bacterium]